MKIVHVGRFKLGTPDGALSALWELTRAQAALGHDVTIIALKKLPDPNDVRIAKENGIRLVGYPYPKGDYIWRDYNNEFAKLIEELRPDIVHLQYVRTPKFFAISRILNKKNVPFIVSLHGGMNSTEMKRKPIRKIIYWNVIEKFIHQKASALHFVTGAERDDYYNRFGAPKPNDAVVPNAVLGDLNGSEWSYSNFNARAPKIAFFGRYDIWHKGLDLAIDLIRRLNRVGIDAKLHLHGSPGKKYATAMSRLVKDNPDIPISDHGYSYGSKMFAAMASYDLYIQYSRFELFGISLVEALSLGVPTLVSEACDLAPELASQRAAVPISLKPEKAAETVMAALQSPEELKNIGERGRKWAIENCNPSAVALQMTKFYERVINE